MYKVDISLQFKKDLVHKTDWVEKVADWIKEKNIEFSSTTFKDTRAVDWNDPDPMTSYYLIFEKEEDAVLFKLKFGGI